MDDAALLQLKGSDGECEKTPTNHSTSNFAKQMQATSASNKALMFPEFLLSVSVLSCAKLQRTACSQAMPLQDPYPKKNKVQVTFGLQPVQVHLSSAPRLLRFAALATKTGSIAPDSLSFAGERLQPSKRQAW